MPSNRSERSDITLDRERVSDSSILEYLDEYGVCIVDSFLSNEQVASIRDEIDTLYENIESTPGVQVHVEEEYQQALNVDYDAVPHEVIPSTSELVSTPDFKSVVQNYYTENDILYPSNLFIARSFGTEDSPEGVIADGPPYALHYDRTNKFKFFFYLTDVTLDEGATHFAPGLHKEIKKRRLAELKQGKTVQQLENTIRDVDQEIIPALGDAGTLLVFDTDLPHHAGGLTEGCSREVLRIDSYSPNHSGIPTSIPGKVKQELQNLLS